MILRVIYLIGKLLTLPGAYLKGFFEHVTARALSIPSEENSYIRMTDGCGHMEHDNIYGEWKNFLFTWLPGVFNFIIGLPFFLAGYSGLFLLKIPFADKSQVMFVVYCILYYVGFSMLANIFPLWDDAVGLWQSVFSKQTSLIAKIVLAIPTLIIIAGALLERYALNILVLVGATAACAIFII